MKNITRRGFLRGVGVCVALPTLESLRPLGDAFGATAGTPSALATTPGGQPLRMGFVAFANGSNYERWLPKGEGRDYQLNETFQPMAGIKDKFQVITSLAHQTANNYGDGPGGSYARAGASFLTGCHAWKTLGSKLQLGISVDQIAARQGGTSDATQLAATGRRGRAILRLVRHRLSLRLPI